MSDKKAKKHCTTCSCAERPKRERMHTKHTYKDIPSYTMTADGTRELVYVCTNPQRCSVQKREVGAV